MGEGCADGIQKKTFPRLVLRLRSLSILNKANGMILKTTKIWFKNLYYDVNNVMKKVFFEKLSYIDKYLFVCAFKLLKTAQNPSMSFFH